MPLVLHTGLIALHNLFTLSAVAVHLPSFGAHHFFLSFPWDPHVHPEDTWLYLFGVGPLLVTLPHLRLSY